MKNFIRSIIGLFLMVICVMTLVSCGNKTKIGILQLLTADPLDDACEGFVAALNEAGYINGENVEIIIKNPEADSSTLNLMAKDLVRNCDLVLGIATPAAVALQNAAKNEGKDDLPILFTAVTAPKEEGLVESFEKPGANITGTSDINPVGEQVALIKEIIPDIKKMGIIYSSDETNSKFQAELAKAKAEELGIAVELTTISKVNEIEIQMSALANKDIEAVYVPTDNKIAQNMPMITKCTEPKKILTVCGEKSQVDNGGSITYSGTDYKELGKVTGEMAVKILKDGLKPSEICVEIPDPSKSTVVINETSFNTIGIKLPDVEELKERITK